MNSCARPSFYSTSMLAGGGVGSVVLAIWKRKINAKPFMGTTSLISVYTLGWIFWTVGTRYKSIKLNVTSVSFTCVTKRHL